MTERAHLDIITGEVWPDSMEGDGETLEAGWYLERYRDGRVLLKVNCIFTPDQWAEFLESLQRGVS